MKEDEDRGAGLLDELEQDGYRRPALWKEVMPWLLAAAILYWVFRGMAFDDFIGYLADSNKLLLAFSLLGFSLAFAAGDAISYGTAYRFSAWPEMSTRQILRARLGAYLLHVLYTPLSTIASMAYLRRRGGIPLTWTLSANAFSTAMDLFVVNAVLTASLAALWINGSAAHVDARWMFAVAAFWLMALGYAAYWFTGVKNLSRLKAVTETEILRSARLARGRDYARVLGARIMVAVSGIVAHGLALRAFGITVPPEMVLLAAPLMIGTSFMPVSGAGFGGPQLVALILLPYADGDKALITAYSMAFSALFTTGRSIIGAVFLRGFIADTRAGVPLLERDPVTEQPVRPR